MCNNHEGSTGMMEAKKKPWGMQYPILRRNTVHVDEISVVPGGYCSVHRHLHKSNLFHVLEGKLTIFGFNAQGAVIRTGALSSGEYCTIPAGEWHQFWSKSGCIAQEVYLGVGENINVIHEDIDRHALFEFGGIAPLLAGVPSMAGVYLSEAGS